MADELSVKATVAYTVSNVQLFQKQWNVDQDKTDQYFENGVVATSTTPSQLSITSGTAGYVIIKNLSTTVGETVHVQTTSTSGVGDHRFATLPIDGGICIYPLKASGAVWLRDYQEPQYNGRRDGACSDDEHIRRWRPSLCHAAD